MSNGQPQIDYTSKDYNSILAALLQLASQKLPEWTDQSPNDLGVMLLELLAAMGDSLFYNQDRIAGEGFLETAVERRSVVQLLRLIGYELSPPLAASADLTLLFAAAATGTIPIPTGTTFKTTAAATGGTPINFQYLQAPLTIDTTTLMPCYVDSTGKLGLDKLGNLQAPPTPAPKGITPYLAYQTLPVVQIDRNVVGEIVASSDGTAGQRYALAGSPVVDETLSVSVDEGAGPVLWTRVDSLVNSVGTDASYAVRRDENGIVWIEFGDGTYGQIPPLGTNNITATYSVGGGVRGNVPASSIAKAVSAVPQLKLVLNLAAASGGADAEAQADAVLRGPQQFRTMGRAVTADDYVTLAKTFGVAKAIAQSPGWNTIQLYIAPVGGGTASDSLKADLLAFLDTKKMMTSIVNLPADPKYVQVLIDATVTVAPQFSTKIVQQAVEDAVASLLAFDNVDFGQTLYISKLYEVMQDVAGVVGVNIVRFAKLEHPKHPPAMDSLPTKTGQLTFSASEIPTWNGFTVVPSLPLSAPDGNNGHLVTTGGVG